MNRRCPKNKFIGVAELKGWWIKFNRCLLNLSNCIHQEVDHQLLLCQYYSITWWCCLRVPLPTDSTGWRRTWSIRTRIRKKGPPSQSHLVEGLSCRRAHRACYGLHWLRKGRNWEGARGVYSSYQQSNWGWNQGRHIKKVFWAIFPAFHPTADYVNANLEVRNTQLPGKPAAAGAGYTWFYRAETYVALVCKKNSCVVLAINHIGGNEARILFL